MSTYNLVLNNWTRHRSLGYTWDEMKIIMSLAKQIDAAKLQYKRIRKVRTAMKKITGDRDYQKRISTLNDFFIDIEFLFSSFQKINCLLRALVIEKNKLLLKTYLKNKAALGQWNSIRNWVEHPLRKIQQKQQKNPSDFGNMVGDYYSIAGERYDVFNQSPKTLKHIDTNLKKLFE